MCLCCRLRGRAITGLWPVWVLPSGLSDSTVGPFARPLFFALLAHESLTVQFAHVFPGARRYLRGSIRNPLSGCVPL